MKEESLKLADELDEYLKQREENPWGNTEVLMIQSADIIRKLVSELEVTKRKYKDMHNLATQAMSRNHQLEKERQDRY